MKQAWVYRRKQNLVQNPAALRPPPKPGSSPRCLPGAASPTPMPGWLSFCLLLTFSFLLLKAQVRAVVGQDHAAWSESLTFPQGLSSLQEPAGGTASEGTSSVRSLWVWRFWWGWGLGHLLAERREVGTQAGGQGPAREAEKGRVVAPGEALWADTREGVWTPSQCWECWEVCGMNEQRKVFPPSLCSGPS